MVDGATMARVSSNRLGGAPADFFIAPQGALWSSRYLRVKGRAAAVVTGAATGALAVATGFGSVIGW